MILWVSLNLFCINFNPVSIVLYFYDIDSANIEFSFPLSCDDSEERIRSIFFLPPFSRTLIKNNRQINLFHAFLFNRKEISNVNVIFPILSSATNRWNDIKKKNWTYLLKRSLNIWAWKLNYYFLTGTGTMRNCSRAYFTEFVPTSPGILVINPAHYVTHQRRSIVWRIYGIQREDVGIKRN